MFFCSVCTKNSQCTKEAEKGVCDTTKNVCVGKLHQSIYMINFQDYSNLILFLLGCTEDGQCAADDNRNICDTTRNLCVGKFNKIVKESEIAKIVKLLHSEKQNKMIISLSIFQAICLFLLVTLI